MILGDLQRHKPMVGNIKIVKLQIRDYDYRNATDRFKPLIGSFRYKKQ